MRCQNVYELCAIYMNPNPNDYSPFLDCLTKVLPMGRQHDEPLNPQLFENCASGSLWWSDGTFKHVMVKSCYYCPKGTPKAAAKWRHQIMIINIMCHGITIDGIHLDNEEQLDFKTEICKALCCGQ